MVVEVPPKVPSSIFCLGPVPLAPCGNGSLVHKRHIKTVIEFCPVSVSSKISLAKLVSCIIIGKVIALDGDGDLNHSSGPAIVVSSIDDCEGSVLDSNVVQRSLQGFCGGDADEGQLVIAGLIAFEWVTIIAGEPSGPIALVAGPCGGLIGESLLGGFETELVNI